MGKLTNKDLKKGRPLAIYNKVTKKPKQAFMLASGKTANEKE